jgi:phosphonate transport system substrate-binding protein
MEKKYILRFVVSVGLIFLAAGAIWIFLARKNVNEVRDEGKEAEGVIITISEPVDLDEEGDFKAVTEEYQPFIDYVAQKLSRYGVKEGKFLASGSPFEASKLIRQGKLDIYADSPFPAFVAGKLAGAEPLVNRWKRGEEKYHSVIFVKKESNIRTLDDLRGKIIVFEKPDSTSAYFLPKAELIKRGYILNEKKGPGDSVSQAEIGYYFAGGDRLMFKDVAEGRADAGAQNEVDITRLTATNKDDYRFIFKTIDVFRHVFMVRGGLDPMIKEALKTILLEMDETPEGREVLEKFKKTTKFTAFEPNIDVAFKGIKELTGLIEKEIIGE